jgi:hypothetical protein
LRQTGPGRLGQQLPRCLTDTFTILNQPGRDLADLAALATDVAACRDRLRELLEQGTRGRDAQTRFCTGLLERYAALWTFTRIPGVPATNNTAERALRHGVLWRKPAPNPNRPG